MNTLIVLPVRGTAPSKTRLSPLFGQEDRDSLVQSMLDHMLDRMPAGVDVAVITRSTDALEGVSPRATIIQQLPSHPGLNGSLQQALRFANDQGYTELLMLPGDLPLLAGHEVDSLLLEDGQMVIVGDRDHQGTNGLRLPTAWADRFTFAMGPQSFANHISEAHRLGIVPVTVYHRGLAHDLDSPDDWFALPDETRQRLTDRMHAAAKGA
jgi:2-phospho-L-lactate/phosphoenolpyruvate guanylyltransferase